MSERNKLRRTLREYYDTQNVSYNEHDWRAASDLLQAERAKNKRRVAAYMFTALLALLFLGFSVYKNFENNSEKPILSYSKTVTKTDRIPAKEKILPESTIPNSYPEKRRVYSANFLKQIATSKRNSPGKQKAPEVVSVASAPLPSSNGFTPDSGSPDKPTPVLEPKLNVGSEETKEQDETKSPELSSAMQQEKISAEEITVLTLPMIYSKEIKESKEDLFLKGSSNFIELDKLQSPDTNTVPADPIVQQLAEEGIFYEVGAGWLYGWKNNAGRDARGFSPLAGINYMNRISNRFALSFGVQYMQVRNLSASSKTSRESIYKYGEQSKVTNITPSTLHYLVIPLRLNYFVDGRNSFGAGFNLSYLLNVEAKIITYDEKPGSTENYKSYKQGGYTEGISWYDSQLALFYTRKIGHSIALKGEVFFGLTDIKQNDFFGVNETERNSGAKITLIYYAFNKKNRQ